MPSTSLSSLLALALLGGCGGSSETVAAPTTPRAPAHDFQPGGPVSDAELGDFHAVLHCAIEGQPAGTLTIAVWAEPSPLSTRRFLRLCDEGYYDGTTFHRIQREFVVQGGDPRGDGTGRGPYGELPLEITHEQEYQHHYGVVSLASPPDMQFFVCVAESPFVWDLDYKAVNVLGHVVHGLQALEMIASVPSSEGTADGPPRPSQRVEIVRAEVLRGPPAATEEVARPLPDLKGEPELILIEQILVTFLERGQAHGVTRNKVEARDRAREAYERTRSGELDFAEAVAEYSDAHVAVASGNPGQRRLSNYGVLAIEGQRARHDAVRQVNTYQNELRARVAAGEITADELTRLIGEHAREIGEYVRSVAIERREDLESRRLGEVAFQLAVGQVGFVPFDPVESPRGWYIVRRVE